ncbi:MAG: colicin import rane protein [Verrucomicrobiota bacterium]
MPKNLRFWSNVTLIALVHVALVVGLIRWSRASSNASAQSVVWLNGGGGDGVVTEKKNPPVPVKSPLPRKESKTESLKEPEPVEDRPYLASAPSDIQLPTPKPSPISTPNRAHTPKAKATPTPKPKPTPKPTPTASPARTPSPKKIVLAKASPKPSPKLKPTPPEKDQSDEERTVDSENKKKAELATQTGSGKGPAPGAGAGRAGGAGSESQFGWYGSMLHDRFYSEWVQPTTVATAGAKNSVLVKLRIEKDGRVSSFEVVRPSGNPDLDESVKMLANRVSRVDPLPDGLGKGDHYDVKINFELNSE